MDWPVEKVEHVPDNGALEAKIARLILNYATIADDLPSSPVKPRPEDREYMGANAQLDLTKVCPQLDDDDLQLIFFGRQLLMKVSC